MSIKKELNALMTAIRQCAVKRCTAISSNGIDVGMSIKKELDTLTMTLVYRTLKRCFAI